MKSLIFLSFLVCAFTFNLRQTKQNFDSYVMAVQWPNGYCSANKCGGKDWMYEPDSHKIYEKCVLYGRCLWLRKYERCVWKTLSRVFSVNKNLHNITKNPLTIVGGFTILYLENKNNNEVTNV